MAENRFVILNSIDCSDKIEKKNGLSYLSWSYAWGEFKKKFPDSYYTVYENKDGWIYFTDGRTCWVKTGVTLVDGDFKLEHIEYLPVMDFKNKSIAADSVDSTNVNKAIQRSLTKALARHGVGLYIYAGEDTPEETEEVKAQKEAVAKEVAILIGKIDVAVKKAAAKMSADEKKAFATDVILPIIGGVNYKACSDPMKLNSLLETLSANKAA